MTVADLNLIEPPEGPDPDRAAPNSWQQIYFGDAGPSLAKGEVENWNSAPASSQQTALRAVLADWNSATNFSRQVAGTLEENGTDCFPRPTSSAKIVTGSRRQSVKRFLIWRSNGSSRSCQSRRDLMSAAQLRKLAPPSSIPAQRGELIFFLGGSRI
jgi:hypothetical protein